MFKNINEHTLNISLRHFYIHIGAIFLSGYKSKYTEEHLRSKLQNNQNTERFSLGVCIIHTPQFKIVERIKDLINSQAFVWCFIHPTCKQRHYNNGGLLKDQHLGDYRECELSLIKGLGHKCENLGQTDRAHCYKHLSALFI